MYTILLGQFGCAQEKEWGKCAENWMKEGNYCMQTCDRCSSATTCSDIPPGMIFGPEKSWTTHILAQICGSSRNKEDYSVYLMKLPVHILVFEHVHCFPGLFGCAQEKDWGKCDEDWMREGNYCMNTCGRCSLDCTDNQPPGKCLHSWATYNH